MHRKFLIYLFLKKIFIVFFVFLCLVFVLNLFDEVSFFKDISSNIFLPLITTSLNSPSIIYLIFPFIFLIAAQLFFIDLIEKEYFDNHNYRKIRKQLILDIAKARIEEITELVIHKNINLTSFLKKKSMIYLNINDYENLKCFENYFKDSFSRDSHFNLKFTKNLDFKEIYDAANLIVQYGWKKEAVPIVQEKKSIISRIFGKIFN